MSKGANLGKDLPWNLQDSIRVFEYSPRQVRRISGREGPFHIHENNLKTQGSIGEALERESLEGKSINLEKNISSFPNRVVATEDRICIEDPFLRRWHEVQDTGVY
jgi:hypothetical protein